jgi:hypothetical protein
MNCRRCLAWCVGVVAIAALLPVVASSNAGTAAAAIQDEYQVKAAFILNFVKYVEWPARSLPDGAPVTVVVLGEQGAGLIQQWLNGKTALSRAIAVRRVQTLSEISPCQVLFVAADAGTELSAALHAVAGQPVLSISDGEETRTTDAVINLSIIEGRVAFSVNLDAAADAGLPLSSKLVALARRVRISGREK